MSALTWQIALAIALGSLASALLRQALTLAMPRSRDAASGFVLAGTLIVGGLIGVAIGTIVTTSASALEGPSPWLIGLIAALGTFGASAVITNATSTQHATRRMWMAVAHIVLAIVAAAFGIELIHWLRVEYG